LRLTHLKLAGFKSFVDPMTLHIHGHRVAVVGPNGCGKSNIMEAIRWVLGESNARELRGDSMQDVIFNGSANRKPISRASVELHFDNSLGGAAGEWSQYAEIAVKRVMERDSGSSYFINNSQVRRRDVADLFLGTGLGGHAYAIIGQNTISRIVEAKPEELRVFLEEAAGISRYKERRRETELRLRDTRANLARVEDIRSELVKQVARLQSQAEVAAEYQRLQQSLASTQSQLWLLKKRAAAINWEKAKRQVERLANELEAQVAQLRKTESEIEHLRQAHHASLEVVHLAQGRYYEANALVSTMEQQLKHEQENRERLAAQLAQIETQQEKLTLQQNERQSELTALASAHEIALKQVAADSAALETSRVNLPVLEQAWQAAQAQLAITRSALAQTEQAIQLETAHLQQGHHNSSGLQQRRQKLMDEMAGLVFPDASQIEAGEAQIRLLEEQLQLLEAEIADLQQREQVLAAELPQQHQTVREQARLVAQLETQRATLQKIQHSIGHEAELDAWFKQSGWDGGQRFWECLTVPEKWETAVESVLGARLNAVMVQDLNQIPGTSRPPVAAVFCKGGDGLARQVQDNGRAPLLAYIGAPDPSAKAVLEDWLAGVHVLADDDDVASARHALRPGEALVNRSGDVFTAHSASFYAPHSALHGVLERQRELEQIECNRPQADAELLRVQAALAQSEQALHNLRHQLAENRHSQRQQAAVLQAQRLEIQRLQQQYRHGLDRRQRLEAELQEILSQLAAAEAQSAQSEGVLRALREQLPGLLSERDSQQQECQSAEQKLAEARNLLLQDERKAQASVFDEKTICNKINELENYVNSILDNHKALAMQRAECEKALTALAGDESKAVFEQALKIKHQREQELAEARNRMNETEQHLQAHERSRLQVEQQLHPQRDKLEQGRLQEQQARLHFEYCAGELSATGADEATLEQALPAAAKPGALERLAAETEAQMTQLGPVNLAAITELASERERNAYLESQSQDLNDAVETLEDAIRRIDRETRGRLQQTFDEANRHFSELFAVLFAGGQARLVLLGEEILDTGVQVFAQPPGKKNTSIHLLSGGEKALTAIALVFALFKLNPAPFCLLDEVDAPLDDSNTERFCEMVKKMSEHTQFLFVSHNKITMEMAQQLIGVTMQESGVSRIVDVDIEAAIRMKMEQPA